MASFRRLVPALAACLAFVVFAQTTDLLVACTDETGVAEHESEAPTEGPAPCSHPTPTPGDTHGPGEPLAADCLCHVVFAPVALAPDVAARPAPSLTLAAEDAETPPEVEPEGLDPVPIA